MVTEREKKWSYFNVLEALLAELPVGDYSADVGEWTNAIARLRDSHEGDYPELFADIHFVLRPRSQAYSRQVSDFFVSQAFGGIKKVMNPAYERMKLDAESKQELSGRNRDSLARYHQVIKSMALELQAAVTIAPATSPQE